MTLITTSAELAAFRSRQQGAGYIAIDTEFLRESTYWPKLCLVQIAGPEEAVAIDPLAPGIDLAPLFDLLADTSLLKVFHAARQDVEIFFHLTGRIPEPLFDTQVAAMVCGFGDSVSYGALVASLAGARLDKSSRFTDWSLRPLTERQLTYALSDVTHLRPAYDKLRRKLDKSGRTEWLSEELAILTDPGTYRLDPDEAWTRIKVRTAKPRFLAVLREVAAWREREAQARDIPRARMLRDEALLEIAAHEPVTVEELARIRGLSRSQAEGRQGVALLEAIGRGRALPLAECPRVEEEPEIPASVGPVMELLRVLLKMKSEQHGVAAKLIATSADLERIAIDDQAAVPALHGWRHEVFGADALALKHGRMALAVAGSRLKLVPVPA